LRPFTTLSNVCIIFALLLFSLALTLDTLLRRVGTGLTILSIVVMIVKDATMFQNTQKLKNGKENAVHTFAIPFLIFATACIPIHPNAWKEQMLLLIVVTRVWIVLR
jgi:hypothetical protein